MVTRLFVGTFTPAIRATLISPVDRWAEPCLGYALRAPTRWAAPEGGTIVSGVAESTESNQLSVTTQAPLTSSMGRLCQGRIDLSGNIVDARHSVNDVQNPHFGVMRDDRRCLLMIRRQPGADRFAIFVRASREGGRSTRIADPGMGWRLKLIVIARAALRAA